MWQNLVSASCELSDDACDARCWLERALVILPAAPARFLGRAFFPNSTGPRAQQPTDAGAGSSLAVNADSAGVGGCTR